MAHVAVGEPINRDVLILDQFPSQLQLILRRNPAHIEDFLFRPEMPLGFARIINLLEDPKEREPVNHTYVRWWVMQHARRLIRSFEESLEQEPLIPAGAPLTFVPTAPATG